MVTLIFCYLCKVLLPKISTVIMKSLKIKLTLFAAILAFLDSLLFHFPFFGYVCKNINADFNGIVIFASLALILFFVNFLVFYLLQYLLRVVNKVILSLMFICNSITLYFINTYDVIVDDTMMGNVFNTNYGEATSYFSFTAVLYIVCLGILPVIFVWLAKINYEKPRRFFRNLGIAVLLLAVTAFANMSNWPWVDHNATIGGSLLMPWSYTVNAVRFYNEERERNRKEILLPDASIRNNDRKALVLVIGESARKDHFSLLGYNRNTNPLLSKTPGVKAFEAVSLGTYTTAGVKAILSHNDEEVLNEILPNYLYRTGVDVVWRTTNWGQSPLHIDRYELMKGYDSELVEGLSDIINSSDSSKVLIILHTNTSHGPSYPERYPKEFEVFSPVSELVEMSKMPHDELMNAYDNSIVYADWLLHETIQELGKVEGRETAMIYVSDHGESLGEHGLYMHGVPMSIAPPEQYEIPFIVWSSSDRNLKNTESLSQLYVFHSVLKFLDIDSPVFDDSKNIFE